MRLPVLYVSLHSRSVRLGGIGYLELESAFRLQCTYGKVSILAILAQTKLPAYDFRTARGTLAVGPSTSNEETASGYCTGQNIISSAQKAGKFEPCSSWPAAGSGTQPKFAQQ